MALCSNRPEGFGPLSHLYGHSLTSCFIDTILIPLCTWLYILSVLKVCLLSIALPNSKTRKSTLYNRLLRNFQKSEAMNVGIAQPSKNQRKIHLSFTILYNLLLVAQALMCILEIVRLSLAHLGTGLLGFIFVSLITAGTLRFTNGLNGVAFGWRWLNLALWVCLAITNGVKVSQEVKEGINTRKGSKYPMVDQVTDISVMIGVYIALGILEICLKP